MSLEVRPADAEDLGAIRTLFEEYANWLREDICLQGFEREVAGLPGAYAPPGGILLIAFKATKPAGCVGLRRLDDQTGEMKRLYVREQFRGNGIGERLAGALIAEARRLGYRRLRLDTLPKMAAAQRLYESLGFRDIPRYNDTTDPGVRFMELQL